MAVIADQAEIIAVFGLDSVAPERTLSVGTVYGQSVCPCIRSGGSLPAGICVDDRILRPAAFVEAVFFLEIFVNRQRIQETLAGHFNQGAPDRIAGEQRVQSVGIEPCVQIAFRIGTDPPERMSLNDFFIGFKNDLL